MEINKKIVVGVAVLVGLSILAFLFFSKKDVPPESETSLGGQSYERVSYDAIGIATTAATVTSVYSANTKTLLSSGFQNLHFDIKYLPKSWDSSVFILVEGSNDDGTTYFPVTIASSTDLINLTSIGLNPEGVTSTAGIPLVFPSDGTSVSGTTYYMMYDMPIIADHIKVSVKESTTSTKGTVYIRTTLTNN